MGTNYRRFVGLVALLTAGLIEGGNAQALQCVPYARVASGIDLRGDAWRWWNAAAGNYERGHRPKLGAVLVFRKHAKMRLGHVAVVRKLIDSRTVLIDHANWGVGGAGRGTVSKMVPLRDVSAHNDWSEVRVWNVATRDFGTRTYPIYGFIYARKGNGSAPTEIVADMPDEVAAELASFAQPAPTPDAPAAATFFAVEMTPVQPVLVPAVSYEPLAPAASPMTPAWLDDRAAAQRAGSEYYGSGTANE